MRARFLAVCAAAALTVSALAEAQPNRFRRSGLTVGRRWIRLVRDWRLRAAEE